LARSTGSVVAAGTIVFAWPRRVELVELVDPVEPVELALVGALPALETLL